jgi:taurine dioxygenase
MICPCTLTDLDLARLPEPAYAARLRRLLGKHRVLVAPERTDLSVSDLVKVAECFGEVGRSLDIDTAHPADPRVQVVARTDPGTSAKPERRGSSQYWHADRSFLALPPAATLLHAQVTPKRGGQTLFAETESALQRAQDFANVNELTAEHSYGVYKRDLQPAFYRSSEIEAAFRDYPAVVHPLVKTDPYSGTRALYLSQLCVTRILELEPRVSSQLLNRLYREILASDGVFAHSWRPGDLVVWCNAAVLHRGTPSAGNRVLHRAVAGCL